jgi:hypothetical protein
MKAHGDDPCPNCGYPWGKEHEMRCREQVMLKAATVAAWLGREARLVAAGLVKP